MAFAIPAGSGLGKTAGVGLGVPEGPVEFLRHAPVKPPKTAPVAERTKPRLVLREAPASGNATLVDPSIAKSLMYPPPTHPTFRLFPATSQGLHQEGCVNRASDLARNEIYFRRTVSTDETLHSIDAVTSADVTKLARTIFSRPQTLAVIGDIRGAKLRVPEFA